MLAMTVQPSDMPSSIKIEMHISEVNELLGLGDNEPNYNGAIEPKIQYFIAVYASDTRSHFKIYYNTRWCWKTKVTIEALLDAIIDAVNASLNKLKREQ